MTTKTKTEQTSTKDQIAIQVAEPTGFCFGVKRAIRLVMQGLKSNKGKVYTLGPIIHNQSVINKLKRLGVTTAPDLSYLKRIKPAQRQKSVVVIRSHGIAPQVIERIEKLGYKIIDATCPYVKRIQNIAEKLKKENFLTVVIGDKKHPEVKGILGYAQPYCAVFKENQKPDSIVQQAKHCGGKIGIVGQTTLPIEYFQKAVKILNNCDELQEIRVYNTLCKESLTRQQICRKLAIDSDIMIVVGGKNSANTRHLVEIAQQFCSQVYQVSEPKEIKPQWLKISVLDYLGGVGIKKNKGKFRANTPLQIGVVAGTSTPRELVLAIVDKIKTSSTSTFFTLAKAAKTTAKEALNDYGR
ncbi:MAG: 4-hydroxy-3-methylbut-2-enyl diphosphate reductase [candidate division WOR-3 bacterium]